MSTKGSKLIEAARLAAIRLGCQARGDRDDTFPEVHSDVNDIAMALHRLDMYQRALEWFADEGHYEETYRNGAGFVDAIGLTQARAALVGMDPDVDNADAIEIAWRELYDPSIPMPSTNPANARYAAYRDQLYQDRLGKRGK